MEGKEDAFELGRCSEPWAAISFSRVRILVHPVLALIFYAPRTTLLLDCPVACPLSLLRKLLPTTPLCSRALAVASSSRRPPKSS